MALRLLVEGHGTAVMLYCIEPGTRFERHRHGFPELGVILSGEGRLVIDGEERAVRAGDAYYFPPDSVHGFAMPEKGEPVVLIDVSAELPVGSDPPSVSSILRLAQSVTRPAPAPPD